MKKFKYLVTDTKDLLWGLNVDTVGYEENLPGEDYPTHGHADGFYFNVAKGRILQEYQMLYVKEGGGAFKSHSVGEVELRSGDIFLLFPDEWHSYRPNDNTGWKCYWLGFKGRNMDDRVNAGFLSPEHPIYHVGYSSEIIRMLDMALHVADEEAIHSQQVLAGITNYLIGLMYSLESSNQLQQNFVHTDIVNRARQMIRETLEDGTTIQEIAVRLGMSYSNFRKIFKEFTGFSPSMYQQDLKLQRAKDLLATTDMTIKEIAYQLNFESPDYFSSKFRLKTGLKPSEFRGNER
ncbi:transcriptional regulator [Prevotella herbatica]|uniref:Transcriptional regulator n=1 Tax=Prevotella herbatica TaxID=2801997 RepID=A0ABN6EG05_9BACT|nr:AraC family transcriptional regulator [Prevotella herbatica]BCS84820.1 transcriptional regulator [Prevotella herbatica]